MFSTSDNETPPLSRPQRLKVLLAEARRRGFRVRSEWLGGETGGACQIGGAPWLFLDLSLPIDEQIDQVEAALTQLAEWSRSPRDSSLG